jgi:hypothetical protein
MNEGRTRSAWSKVSRTVTGFGTATHQIPAAFAAVTPWGESSNAMASSGGAQRGEVEARAGLRGVEVAGEHRVEAVGETCPQELCRHPVAGRARGDGHLEALSGGVVEYWWTPARGPSEATSSLTRVRSFRRTVSGSSGPCSSRSFSIAVVVCCVPMTVCQTSSGNSVPRSRNISCQASSTADSVSTRRPSKSKMSALIVTRACYLCADAWHPALFWESASRSPKTFPKAR